jgi:hypothetical protein
MTIALEALLDMLCALCFAAAAFTAPHPTRWQDALGLALAGCVLLFASLVLGRPIPRPPGGEG